ncbi:PadR family transcriptional regulator [Thalassiella azotivora]
MATLRITEQLYLVLLALADQPRHGYGVVEAVRAMTDGDVVLRPGTLYGVLDRLVAAGWAVPEREEVVDGRLRRYYALTSDGAAAARAETERLAALTRSAARVLRARPAGGTA